jgi:hypothetical protein
LSEFRTTKATCSLNCNLVWKKNKFAVTANKNWNLLEHLQEFAIFNLTNLMICQVLKDLPSKLGVELANWQKGSESTSKRVTI